MNEKELISVIMSTYNEPEVWLRSSIESILNQTYENIEFIIVCDNPENLMLKSILKEYSEDERVTVLFNEKNLGIANSLNKALKFAKGKYIARMDADDIADANRLVKQYNYLITNELDLIGGGLRCIDEDNKIIPVRNNLPKMSDDVKKKIVKNSCLHSPTIFGRYNVFSKLNGYRNIKYAEDYDLLFRAIANEFKLGNTNEVVLQYRVRKGSISNNNGLKQFITSQQLVKLYEDGKILHDIGIINREINKEVDKITSGEEDNYYKASRYFIEGCIGLKSFNIKEATKIPRAIVKSKSYRQKIGCYIKGLL